MDPFPAGQRTPSFGLGPVALSFDDRDRLGDAGREPTQGSALSRCFINTDLRSEEEVYLLCPNHHRPLLEECPRQRHLREEASAVTAFLLHDLRKVTQPLSALVSSGEGSRSQNGA